jgi:hypothetical protein
LVAIGGLCAQIAFGQPAETRCLQGSYNPSWPVVQVASGRTGQLVMGTGVSIGGWLERRLFVTAAHTVSDYTAPIAVVNAEFSQMAELLAVDQEHDVALISARLPARTALATFRLVARRFARGGCGTGGCNMPGNRGQMQIMEPQQGGGCGGVGNWGGFSPDAGQFRSFSAPTLPSGKSGEWIQADGRLMAGMSGGAVYQNDGLLGVIIRSSKDEQHALAVTSDWLIPWVIAALEIDAKPAEWIADYRGFGDWQPVSWGSRGPQSTIFAAKPLFSR